MANTSISIRKVFGYINKHGANEFPAPLGTVVESGAKLFLVDGYGVSTLLVDEATGLPAAKEEISLRDTFILATTHREAADFFALTSFGFAKDSIAVGTPQDIFERIGAEIDRDQHTGDSLDRLMAAYGAWEEFLNKSPSPEKK